MTCPFFLPPNKHLLNIYYKAHHATPKDGNLTQKRRRVESGNLRNNVLGSPNLTPFNSCKAHKTTDIFQIALGILRLWSHNRILATGTEQDYMCKTTLQTLWENGIEN